MRSLFLIPMLLAGVVQHAAIPAAASRFVPGTTWQPQSVVEADFTCRGRREQAILGFTADEIIIAVFIGGATQPPEVLRYSARVRDPRAARLTTEGLDWDPKRDEGIDLPGFQWSRTCKGLNLSDGKIDSAHIYWNHVAKRFDDWVR